MTITFENDHEVIVYALEKVICYARDNHYLFIAQSIWWIASVIGLSKELATHIDNLKIRFEASQLVLEEDQLSSKENLITLLPENLETTTQESCIHPDRILQVNKDNEYSEAESSQAQLDRATAVIQSAKKFIGLSRKERNALKKKPCGLSKTRSGKILVKPLTKKQRNRLWAIPIATLSEYLESRNQK